MVEFHKIFSSVPGIQHPKLLKQKMEQFSNHHPPQTTSLGENRPDSAFPTRVECPQLVHSSSHGVLPVQADYGKTVRGIVTGEAGFLKLIFDRSLDERCGGCLCSSVLCRRLPKSFWYVLRVYLSIQVFQVGFRRDFRTWEANT